jgi:hypothetical protein
VALPSLQKSFILNDPPIKCNILRLFEKSERLPAKLEKWTPSDLLSPRGEDKGGGRNF